MESHRLWLQSEGRSGQRLVLRDAMVMEEYLLSSGPVGIGMRHGELRKAVIQHSSIVISKEIAFIQCDLRHCTFENDDLRGSSFHDCDLRGIYWYNYTLNGVSFKGSRLIPAGLFGDWKTSLEGLRDGEKAYFARGNGLIALVDYAISWARIRAIGNLPLFGVSNTALALIFVWGAAVAAAQRFAARASESVPDHVRWVLDLIWPIGHSLELAGLAVALILVSIASAIFKLAAPDIVQGYTEARWARELGHQAIEHRAASFCRPVLRWVCAGCYLLGIGYIVLYYVPCRAWVAISALAG